MPDHTWTQPADHQCDPRPAAGSVWDTGTRSITTHINHGGYLPDTLADTQAIPPAIAAHAITAYSPPGGLVLDPDCGAGTVLAEAVRLDRHAIGATRDRRWWALARANLTTAGPPGAGADRADGMVLDTDLTAAGRDEPVGALTGHADLILTTPRLGYPGSGAGPDPDRKLPGLLADCGPLLRPGGYLVVTTRPRYRHGRRTDRPGHILAAGLAAGLIPVERCVALTAKVRGDQVNTRASLAHRRAAANAEHATGRPGILPAHHNVHVFRTPRDLADIPRTSTAPDLDPEHGTGAGARRQLALAT